MKNKFFVEEQMEKSITYVYAIIHETDISGAWTDPEEAIKYQYRYDLATGGKIELEDGEPLLTVKEVVKKMLEPNRDYPYLAKIKVNPSSNNEVWELDR